MEHETFFLAAHISFCMHNILRLDKYEFIPLHYFNIFNRISGHVYIHTNVLYEPLGVACWGTNIPYANDDSIYEAI